MVDQYDAPYLSHAVNGQKFPQLTLDIWFFYLLSQCLFTNNGFFKNNITNELGFVAINKQIFIYWLISIDR